MEFYEKPSLEDLEHYGVLGMKWGVRRTPEQLGHHKIPKGTVMYRTTANESESLFGPKYVTYLPPDRDLYRGGWSSSIKKNYGKSQDSKVYENQYELKEDLNIPSRDTVKKAYDKVMANDKTKKKALQNYFEAMFSEDEAAYKFYFGDNWQKQLKAEAKNFTDDAIKNWGEYTVEDKFTMTARSIGVSPILKTSIISELKKQGYNAMVDEAGVGGQGKYGREGVEPIIIFDGDDSLSKTNTTEITSRVTLKAMQDHAKWYRVANSARNRKNPW